MEDSSFARRMHQMPWADQPDIVAIDRPMLRAASWPVINYEANAAYRVDVRLRNAQTLTRGAVDAVIALDDYILWKAEGRDPALVAGLHDLQAVTSACTTRLIFDYLARPV